MNTGYSDSGVRIFLFLSMGRLSLLCAFKFVSGKKVIDLESDSVKSFSKGLR